MDITDFLQLKEKKDKKKIINPKSKEEDEKKQILIDDNKTKYSNLLNKFVKSDTIDLLEYSNLMDYYKSKGSLVNLARFTEIVSKIYNDKNIDNGDKDQFADICVKVFDNIFSPSKKDDVYNGININEISDIMIKEKDPHISFSIDQKNAINHIIKFLVSQKLNSFGLYGFAGTGKTTLIVELVHFLLKNHYISSVVLAAPTNKAVNIMKAKFRYELKELIKERAHEYELGYSFDENLDKLNDIGMKVDFITIHKLLNYQNDFDIDGNRIFVKGKSSNINRYDLVIVDECSMIQLDIIINIFDEINKELKKNTNTTKKVPKILFVGDPAQLPPVSEDVSIIFCKDTNCFTYDSFEKIFKNTNNSFYEENDDDIKKKYDEIKQAIMDQQTYTLTEVVRNKDDMVVGLCNNIRQWVMNTIKSPTVGMFKGNGVFLYNYDKKGKQNTKWFKTYLKNISKNDEANSSIILTWTNQQTDDYNQYAREHIFKKGKNNKQIKKYEIGDILILNDFYNMDESEVKDKRCDTKKFYTSEQIRIADIDEFIKACSPLPEYLSNKTKKMKNIVIITDKYRGMVKLINSKTKRKYNVWKLHTHRLADILINNTIPEVYEMLVVKDESKQDLEKDIEFCTDKIKILRQFYKTYYPEQINQIDREIIKPLWREVNKTFIKPFANVNMGNSITCHKSQGSTFYNIFVDADDILKNTKPNEAKRCIYTALTRASNEIHILF